MNANVGSNIGKSLVDDMSTDDDDWDVEDAVGLENEERAGMKQKIWNV